RFGQRRIASNLGLCCLFFHVAILLHLRYNAVDMRFRKEFIKTRRTVSREIESINGQLLTKGGFVHQEIAGVYSFLPLGLRALNKVEAIIRKHMNEIATEIVMSALQPVANWKTTSRL